MFNFWCFPHFYKFRTNGLYLLLLFCVVLEAQTDSLSLQSYKNLEKRYQENINSKPQKALVYAEEMYLRATQEKQQRNIGYALQGIANSHIYLSNNTKALKSLEKAINIGNQLQDYELLYRCYNLMGIAYNQSKEDSKALEA